MRLRLFRHAIRCLIANDETDDASGILQKPLTINRVRKCANFAKFGQREKFFQNIRILERVLSKKIIDYQSPSEIRCYMNFRLNVVSLLNL